MNAPASPIEIPSSIGTNTEIGIYFARIRVDNSLYALFQPPKAISQHAPAAWNGTYQRSDDALSLSDGYTNTVGMAKAGSKLAQWALDGGMYIPAIDELDLQYRFFKPSARENDYYMRSGINLNAEPPLHPHTPDAPQADRARSVSHRRRRSVSRPLSLVIHAVSHLRRLCVGAALR